MTYRYIKQFVRSSKEVEFYADSPDFLQHVTDNYIKTGKCLKFREATFFDDEELVISQTSLWVSQEIFQEFANDPMLAVEIEKLISYNQEHKIRLLDLIEEELLDDSDS